jgi:hypothetical protein
MEDIKLKDGKIRNVKNLFSTIKNKNLILKQLIERVMVKCMQDYKATENLIYEYYKFLIIKAKLKGN